MSISKIPNLSKLTPIQGVAYSPVPSDDKPQPPQKYFDTDFTNSTFPLIWGQDNGGRGDIKNLSSIGVNFLHLYNWSVPPKPNNPPTNYQRNHISFLQECAKAKVNVLIPISNYFMGQIHQGNGAQVKSQIKDMVSEVYNNTTQPMAGAGMWGIANEYDLAGNFSVEDVVQAMIYLVEAEQSLNIPADNLLPITSPVSFDKPDNYPPAIVAIQKLEAAIKKNLGESFWSCRFVASTNPFNDGDFLLDYIDDKFPKYFPDLPFFFAEMGMNINGLAPNPEKQAEFVLKQLQNTNMSGNFLGRCVFQFLDQTAMKTGTEATFGINHYSGNILKTGTIPQGYIPGGGETYPVDELTQKPLYESVKSVYLSATHSS